MEKLSASHSYFVNADAQGTVLDNDSVSFPTDSSSKISTSLYEIAKAKAWNASTQLDWPETVNHKFAPVKQRANLLQGFAPFEEMPQEQKIKALWQQHSIDIADILCGERAALVLSAQLLSRLTDERARLFLSSQVFDEARHVEFFSRYQLEVVQYNFEPCPGLKNQLTEAINNEDPDHKILVCQIIIESLAMARFQQLKADTQVPLLRQAIRLITKDEARHVKFGCDYFKRRIAALDVRAREQHSNFVVVSVLDLSSQIRQYLQLAELWEWDRQELLAHLRRQRIAHPNLYKSANKYLARNLEAIGLDGQLLSGGAP